MTPLGIDLWYLPSYSPNPNHMERRWKFVTRRALHGLYHPTFRELQAGTHDGLPTAYADQLASLMKLNFQEFEGVSLLAV